MLHWNGKASLVLKILTHVINEPLHKVVIYALLTLLTHRLLFVSMSQKLVSPLEYKIIFTKGIHRGVVNYVESK